MTAYDEFPASAQQAAMWFVESLAPGSARYHVPAAVDLTGSLDTVALHRALRAVVARHESLRTGFAAVAGQPVQRVHHAADIELPIIDQASAADADRAEAALAVQPFDLAGPSLLRAALLRLGPHEHRLVLVAHHLVCDAWSSAIMLRDLAAAYRGQPLPPGEIDYADYAVWQQAALTPAEVERHTSYWRARLDPLPEPVALPVDRTRPPARGGHGGTRAATLPPVADPAPFALLLAATAGALHRLTGQTDLVLGVVAAQRDRPELEPMVGCLVNTVPVRLRCDATTTLDTLRHQARQALLDAVEHVDLPFDRLVEALRPPRDPGRLPLVDVLVTGTPAGPPDLDLPGVAARVRRLATGTAKADLTVEADGRDLRLEYDLDVLGADTADWLARAIPALTAAPGHLRPPDVDLLAPGEADLLTAHDHGPAPAGRPASVPDRFHAAARRWADLPAVEAADGCYTYAELADRVRRCAAGLAAAGVRPGDRVGVRAGNGAAWPVLILGAMHAGAAPVLLDPDYPAARVDTMNALAATAVTLDHAPDAPDGPADPVPVDADDVGAVIFTSGSTGQPKGAALTHGNLARLIDTTLTRFGLGPGDRILQLTSPAFDAALWDLMLALLSGATLCLAPSHTLLPGPVLRDTLRERRVSYVFGPPSALSLIPADQPLPDLRIMVSGGEACPVELVRRWAPGTRVCNVYGPTETTIIATLWESTGGVPAGPVPLGDPLPGVGVHLLDEALRPVPPGVPGEIHLSGVGLGLGYVGRGDLTAAAFGPGPGGRRCYRTGDRAVRRADGTLVFVGRRDSQVKIRGFRVEPAEAELALRAQPGIQAAAVVTRPVAGGHELVGYYVPADRPGPDPADLRTALAATLPAYLVPAHLVALPALPVTTTGKLDRAALPAPAPAARTRPPRPGLEQHIAALWCEVLEVPEVGADDNFFDAGGHSLALGRVHARLCADLDRDIAVVDLFSHPTVAALAAHLSGPDTAAAAAATGRDRAAQRRAAQQQQQQRRGRS